MRSVRVLYLENLHYLIEEREKHLISLNEKNKLKVKLKNFK